MTSPSWRSLAILFIKVVTEKKFQIATSFPHWTYLLCCGIMQVTQSKLIWQATLPRKPIPFRDPDRQIDRRKAKGVFNQWLKRVNFQRQRAPRWQTAKNLT